MIREFSVRPKPTNNKARILFIVCSALAFALVTLSTVIRLYRGLVSMAGVVLLTLALALYTKYILPVYFYDIFIDSDGTPLFVVRQQTGKRHTTLCRIPLYEIVRVEKQSRQQRREHKTPYEVKKYAYLPTVDPDVVFRITTSSRHERAEILIESSDGFAELLSAYSVRARDMYSEDY